MSKQEQEAPQKRKAKDVLICIDFDLTMTTEHVHSMMNNAMKNIDQDQASQLHKNNGVLLHKKVGEEQYQVSLDNDELSDEQKGVTGYQKNTAVIAKTNELLNQDKIHLKNEEELKKTLKELLKDGHPIAITSFSHFPDAIETIIQEKLGKRGNALTKAELQKIQIVTGFPSDYDGKGRTAKGKTEHMLMAAENAGMLEGMDIPTYTNNPAIVHDRILLMDDTTRNVEIAQDKGMRGVAVPMVSYDKTTFSETPCKLEQYNYLSQLKTEAKNAVEGKPFEKINIETFEQLKGQALSNQNFKIEHEQILANPKAAEPAKAPEVVGSPKAEEQPEPKKPAANKSVHVCFGFESLLENAEGFNQLLDRQAATGQTNLRPHPEGDLVFSFEGKYTSSKDDSSESLSEQITQTNQATLKKHETFDLNYGQPLKAPKVLKKTLTELAKQGNEISIVSFNKYPGIVEHEIDKLRLPKEVRSKISIISGSPDEGKAKDKDYSQHLEVVKGIADADSKEVVFFDSNEKSLNIENKDYTVLAPLDSTTYPEVLEVLPAVVETIAPGTNEYKDILESTNKSRLEQNKKILANPKAEPAKAPKIVDSPKASEQPEQKEPAANKSVHVCFGFESLFQDEERLDKLLNEKGLQKSSNITTTQLKTNKSNELTDTQAALQAALTESNQSYESLLKSPEILKKTLTELAKQGNEISIVSFNKYPGIVEHEIDKLRLPKEVRSKISIISGSPGEKKAKDKDYSQHLAIVKQIADADSKEVVFFDSNEKMFERSFEVKIEGILAPLNGQNYQQRLSQLPQDVKDIETGGYKRNAVFQKNFDTLASNQTINANIEKLKQQEVLRKQTEEEKQQKVIQQNEDGIKRVADKKRQELEQKQQMHAQATQQSLQPSTNPDKPPATDVKPIAVPPALEGEKGNVERIVQELKKTLPQLPLSEKEKREVQDDLAKVSQSLGVDKESPVPTTPSTLTQEEASKKLETIQQEVQNQQKALENQTNGVGPQTKENRDALKSGQEEEYKVAASKIGNICKIISLVVDKIKISLSRNIDEKTKENKKLVINSNIEKEWDAFKGKKAAPTHITKVVNNPLSQNKNSDDGWIYNNL